MADRHAQAGFALWFTGLPASGKSSLAQAFQRRLAEAGIAAVILDSDELRQILTPQPTYAPAERDWFYGVIAWLAALLTQNGVNVLIAATAPRRVYRERARQQIPRLAVVWVKCPPSVCRQRDPKGLWRRAATGEVTNLPGADLTYEQPAAPEAIVDTSDQGIAEAVNSLWTQLETRSFWNKGAYDDG